jgi:hypothetical protein
VSWALAAPESSSARAGKAAILIFYGFKVSIKLRIRGMKGKESTPTVIAEPFGAKNFVLKARG